LTYQLQVPLLGFEAFKSLGVCSVKLLFFSIFSIDKGAKDLEAGKKYYMEILYHEYDADDYFFLGMIKPFDGQLILVTHDYLEKLP